LALLSHGGTSIMSEPAGGICARNRPKHLKASCVHYDVLEASFDASEIIMTLA